jgi:hypothetical protein
MTRKLLIILAAAALLAVPAALQGHGGFGNGNGNGGGNGNGSGYGNGNGNGNGGGNGNGNGPIHNILEGVPFSYTGTVVSIGLWRDGTVISTDSEDVTVYGLGPWRYWDSLGVNMPDIGNVVTVNGFNVDFNGVSKNVLMSVIIDGVTVELRDSETGTPLWRNGVNRNGNGGNGYGPSPHQPRYDILNGTPFSFAGDVMATGVGSFGDYGSGMTISAADGNVTVDGLGPWHYWEWLGTARPVVGDYVEVAGYTVEYNGIILNILMSVVIDGQTVQLRDPETGLPLWGHGYRGSI